jgi:hypothetical protein
MHINDLNPATLQAQQLGAQSGTVNQFFPLSLCKLAPNFLRHLWHVRFSYAVSGKITQHCPPIRRATIGNF